MSCAIHMVSTLSKEIDKFCQIVTYAVSGDIKVMRQCTPWAAYG